MRLGCVFVLLYVAFLASFFLPAMGGLEVSGTPPGTPLSGWQVLKCAIVTLHPVALLAPQLYLLVPCIVVANIVAAFSPMMRFVLRDDGAIAAPVLFGGAVAALLLPDEFMGEMLIGYWLWVVSLIGLSMYFAASRFLFAVKCPRSGPNAASV